MGGGRESEGLTRDDRHLKCGVLTWRRTTVNPVKVKSGKTEGALGLSLERRETGVSRGSGESPACHVVRRCVSLAKPIATPEPNQGFTVRPENYSPEIRTTIPSPRCPVPLRDSIS